MKSFTKVVCPGTIPLHTYTGEAQTPVFVRIKYETCKPDSSRLSITGVEGPRRNGDCWGGCGQITLKPSEFGRFDPGWDRVMVAQLQEYWDAWHLNDLRAGCPHQRALGWTSCRGLHHERFQACDRDYPNLQAAREGGIRQWEPYIAHYWWCVKDPVGVPCPECGYKYGTQWLHEPVPEHVLQWLHELPDTERRPAWT